MKNKNKTYKGKITSARRQQRYWQVLTGFFFAAVIFLGIMGEHYTTAYTVVDVNVPQHEAKDLSILDVLNGTPMEDAKPYIIKASDYYGVPVELYLGIAFAESSFSRYKCYNPWGIGNNGPRCYNNWEHSVNGFSQLIKYYYLEEGLVTPEALLRKYVGWNNPDWVVNVSTYYTGSCR